MSYFACYVHIICMNNVTFIPKLTCCNVLYLKIISLASLLELQHLLINQLVNWQKKRPLF